MTIAENRCPYCHSTDITIVVDVTITVGCHLEDKKLVLDNSYSNSSASQLLTENLGDVNPDNMEGFCHHCGEYFGVDHVDEKGFWFCPEYEEEI